MQTDTGQNPAHWLDQDRRLPWLAFFLIVTAARFLLIAAYGSDTGVEDDWSGIVRDLYRPFAAGQLHPAGLFGFYNEHMIFTTHLYELFMLKLNGGLWSPVLLMAGNAIIQGLAVTLMTRVLMTRCPLPYRTIYYAFSLVVWGLPLAIENVLVGFQTQMYLLLLTVFFFLRAIVDAEPLSRSWWLGMASGLLAALTMAGGPLAMLVAAGFLGLRYFRLGGGRADLVTVLALLVLVLGIFAITPAHSGPNPFGRIDYMALAMARMLSWPSLLGVGLIIYLPALRFLLALWRHPLPARHDGWLLLLMLLWVLALMAGIAFARTFQPLLTRYDDFFITGLVLAFVLALRQTHAREAAQAALPEAERKPPPYMPFVQLWLLVVMSGILFNGYSMLPYLEHKLKWDAVATANVRVYMQTGNFAALDGKEFPEIPYHSGHDLKALLDNPGVRSVLPPSLLAANAARQPVWSVWLLSHLRPLGMALLLAGFMVLGLSAVRPWRTAAASTSEA
jgi:hypothetical protein